MINLLNSDHYKDIRDLNRLTAAVESIVTHLIPSTAGHSHYCAGSMGEVSTSLSIAEYVVQDAIDTTTAIDAIAHEAGLSGLDAYEALNAGRDYPGVTDTRQLWDELALNAAGRIVAISAGADSWQTIPDQCLDCGAILDFIQ